MFDLIVHQLDHKDAASNFCLKAEGDAIPVDPERKLLRFCFVYILSVGSLAARSSIEFRA